LLCLRENEVLLRAEGEDIEEIDMVRLPVWADEDEICRVLKKLRLSVRKMRLIVRSYLSPDPPFLT
jgi:hypothetical protein